MLLLILIVLVTENVNLAQNEKIEPQDILDSTNFKNALAKELLKKKLLNLESARQQDSLAQFLKKGNPIRGKPNFNVDDDPSRKQAQMANSFIASSNLLFGTKSQRRACNTGSRATNKEAVLDMQTLKQSFSGYNEEGPEFPSTKYVSAAAAVRKRSLTKKNSQDPISCYLTEPKKVTCMHKDIIYKIQLPSSDVADDEIGRIVESIYRAVEVNRSAIGRGTIDDSSKRKRASSDDYLKSLFLNNLIFGAHPKTPLVPTYNGNNAIYLPLIIPVSQSKLDAAKAPLSYYPGLLVDPKLQVPYNISLNGLDTLTGISSVGKNVPLDNGYGGQYLIPESYLMPASNLRQRSDNNMTTDEEKRRNWLALMATNGYVPIDGGMNAKLTNSDASHLGERVQSLSEDKDLSGSSRKLTIAETGEFLDKLFNKRQERDTYYLRRQLRNRPLAAVNNVTSDFYGLVRENQNHIIPKFMGVAGEIDVEGRMKGQQCPCPKPTCTTKCTTTCSPRCTTKCPPKCPTPCPTPCPLPCPIRCPCPKPCPPPCPAQQLPQYPTVCSTPCPTTCTTPCSTTCTTPCPTQCPTTCSSTCPPFYADYKSGVISNIVGKTSRQRHVIKSPTNGNLNQNPYNVNAQSIITNQQPPRSDVSNVAEQRVNIISGKTVSQTNKDLIVVANSSVAMDLKAKKPKDSFFSRLRSKFHKGVLTNNTAAVNNSDSKMPNKWPSSIIKFSQGPSGQVWHVSHELSVSANQLRHQPNASTTAPQQTTPSQSNQTRSVVHFNQPNQPNQPVIPLTSFQPTTPQPPLTVNQNQPPAYQPQYPGNQIQQQGNMSQPATGYSVQPPAVQPVPSAGQALPSPGSQPQGNQPMLPPGSQPQVVQGNQPVPPPGCQPALQPIQSQPPLPPVSPCQLTSTTTQCTFTTSCTEKTTQTTCNNRYQTTLFTVQPPNLTNSRKMSNFFDQQQTSNKLPLMIGMQGPAQEPQLRGPFRTQYFPKSQQKEQSGSNQFPPHQRQQGGRLQDTTWQQPANGENLQKQPNPLWSPGQQFNQPQPYPSQLIHTTHLRIQPNIPPSSISETSAITQNVAPKFEYSFQNLNRLPRTSFKNRAKTRKTSGRETSNPSQLLMRKGRKVKWPLRPYSIYEKIARVRRYLKSRKRRETLTPN